MTYIYQFVFNRFVAVLLGLPLALIIYSISPWIKIRLVSLFSNRVAHHALNTELLLCALESNLYQEPKNQKTFFYVVPWAPIANMQLHRMWKRVIPVLPFPVLWSQVDKILMCLLGQAYRNDPIKKTFETAEGAEDKWGFLENMKPHLSFTDSENKRGWKILTKMGIPTNASFVCLLGRDSRYLNKYLPGTDWSYHDYRNVDINNYKIMANYLTEKGYYVIRMGKAVKQKFELNNPKVIDYATSKNRSDFMDIFLSAHCDFFISPRTGLDAVVQIFRRPILITDFPLCDFRALYYLNLFIPKKVLNNKTNQYLSFREACWGKDRQGMKEMLEKKGWKFVDNSPEELLEVAKEMVDEMSGHLRLSVEDKVLQKKFWQSVSEVEPNNYFMYQNMRIGKDFLAKHQNLIERSKRVA